MKLFALVIVLLLVFAFSGCLQPQTPEEKAKAIAGKLPEIQVISGLVNSMANMDKCTMGKLLAGYKQVMDSQGLPMPEITAEQRTQMEQMIEKARQFSTTCKPSMTSRVEKQSENSYMVFYKIEAATHTECQMFATSSELKVSVDLSKETASLDGTTAGSFNSESFEQAKTALDALGDCAGLMFYSTSMATSITTA